MPRTTKQCFVISPIGDPNSTVRKRSNGYLREVLRPVAEEFGYVVERADHDRAPGLITETIVRKIVDADLVIADLHEHNPNVMYELAIRHATGQSLIQMIEVGERLPFDIGELNTIFYDPSLDGLHRWRGDLHLAITAVEAGNTGTNPIARAGLFRALEAQPAARGDIVTELLRSIENLRHEIRASTGSRGVSDSSDAEGGLVVESVDHVVHSQLADFITTDGRFANQMFALDVSNGTIELTVPPKRGDARKAVKLRYTLDFGSQNSIRDEVARIKDAIVRDLHILSRAAENTDTTDEPKT